MAASSLLASQPGCPIRPSAAADALGVLLRRAVLGRAGAGLGALQHWVGSTVGHCTVGHCMRSSGVGLTVVGQWTGGEAWGTKMHHNALERQLSRGLGGGLAVVWLHGCTWPAAALPAVAWGMWAACGNVGRLRPPQRAWQPRPGENLPQPRRPWLGERLPQQHTCRHQSRPAAAGRARGCSTSSISRAGAVMGLLAAGGSNSGISSVQQWLQGDLVEETDVIAMILDQEGGL